MKKLFLVIWLVAATGCSNPIGSAVDKEGEETRLQMQAELDAARAEIIHQMQLQFEFLNMSLPGSFMDYTRAAGNK